MDGMAAGERVSSISNLLMKSGNACALALYETWIDRCERMPRMLSTTTWLGASSSKRVFTAGKKGNHGVVLLIMNNENQSPQEFGPSVYFPMGGTVLWRKSLIVVQNTFVDTSRKLGLFFHSRFYPYTWLFSDFLRRMVVCMTKVLDHFFSHLQSTRRSL